MPVKHRTMIFLFFFPYKSLVEKHGKWKKRESHPSEFILRLSTLLGTALRGGGC